MNLFGLTLSQFAANIILYFNGLSAEFLGKLLAMVAGWLGSFLKFQGGYFESIRIVQNSWAVFRDFSNMFFILILIIIAFATILDIEKYNWKGLMARFIIAALLINFSLAIGGFIIRISTTLSNVALNQFTDITANLAAGFGLNKLITGTSTIVNQSSPDVVGNAISSTLISGFGMNILTLIVLSAFITAFAFAVARVPVLWALLIVSPVAWISYVLPDTKKVWDTWWEWFLCWTFFMPIYLFSLVLGIGILSNRPDIETAINLSGGTTVGANLSNFAGFTIQDIFFYVLTIIIMVGTLAASMKAACSGSGVVVKAVSGRVNKFVKENTGYAAWIKGLTGKAKEIQDVGLQGKIGSKIYGGERAERLREAKVAEILGKKSALSEQEAAETKKTYDRYKSEGLDQDKTGLDALNTQALAGQLSKYEVLALRKLRAENGWVASGNAGVKEIEDTIREAGENSRFAAEYTDALKKNGFEEALGSVSEAENLARNTTILPLKKAVLETMAKNNQIIKEDLARMTLDVFANESRAVKDSIEKEIQENIKNFNETRTGPYRAVYLLDNRKDPRIRRLLANQMADDGEINNYAKYATAVNLFGGKNETKSREMLNKIAKEKPLANAEIQFREELAITNPASANPSYTPTTTEIRHIQPKIEAALKRMDAAKIAEADKDMWKLPEFQAELQSRVTELELKDPTVPGRPGRKQKDGAGLRMKKNLIKTVGSDIDKLTIANRLRV